MKSNITKQDVLNVANSYNKTIFKPTEAQITEIVQTANECSEDFGDDNFSEIIEQLFYSLNVEQIEKESIQENNKLIAEFMDVDQVDIDTWLEDNKELKYHSSWGWLMPVVEKIEGLKLGDLKGLITDKHGNKDEHFNCVAGIEIRGSYCNIYIQADMRLVDNFIEATMEDKISATYKAIVEFIKWYNKQKDYEENNAHTFDR